MKARRGRPDLEVDQELDAFIALLTDEKVAAGMSRDDARRQALIEAGSLEAVKEEARDLRPFAFFDRLRQDVRFGLRLLARTPGSTLAVILTLALGIGATSATFSVVDAVLLRPLAYRDADRLVVVLHERTRPVSPANFLDWRRQVDVFADMGAAEYWTPNLTDVGPAEKLYALRVTTELLPLLGVPPAIGRLPVKTDDGAREVAIADGLWRRAFGGDPSALGRSIRLDGIPHTIVGVMPGDFRFAPFWATRAELWAPIDLAPRAHLRTSNSLRVFARLRAGVSLDHARASVAALTATLEGLYPGTNRDVTVTPLKDMVVGDVRPAIVILFAGVGLVLLVSCANVAHLLLARSASRTREFAVRGALGATRSRLVRQLLTEHALLAGAGGLAGLVIAWAGIGALRSLGGSSIPRVDAASLDGRVLAFTTTVSLLTTLVFGLLPAIRQARPNLSSTLRDADRGSISRRARRLRRVLIASEVAMATVLLLGAGLLMRSFVALRAIDPGFDTTGLVSFVVSVSGTAESAPDRRLAFYGGLLERLRALPGVEAAAAINHVPLAGDIWGAAFLVEGRPTPAPGELPSAAYRVVLPGYFQTMRLPLARGRDFTEADRAAAPAVVIVSQHLADTQWPGEDPIGQRIQLRMTPNPEWLTVVGVAAHAVRSEWQDRPDDEVYLPLMQTPLYRNEAGAYASYFSYVVRAPGDPAAIAEAARAIVRGVAPGVPVSEVTNMDRLANDATTGPRFTLTLLGTFAAVALMLAVVGLYGVMSRAVTDRRREIGIRLALGAGRGGIVARVVGEGLTVASAGLLAGVAATFLLGGVLRGLLHGIGPMDPPTVVVVVLVLTMSAAMAAYVPARRASRINPQQELR